MQVVFNDPKLEELYRERKSKRFHPDIIKLYVKRINFLMDADNMRTIYARTSLHCERLGADREGQLSIRLNRSRRLLFRLDEREEVSVI